MTDTHGTPQPSRVFIQLEKGTILDLISVEKTETGITGYVQNGAYPVDLTNGVLSIPGHNNEPARNVRVIYEGAPPCDRSYAYGPSIDWIKANEGKWIKA